jgi:hypothetical protein
MWTMSHDPQSGSAVGHRKLHLCHVSEHRPLYQIPTRLTSADKKEPSGNTWKLELETYGPH